MFDGTGRFDETDVPSATNALGSTEQGVQYVVMAAQCGDVCGADAVPVALRCFALERRVACCEQSSYFHMTTLARHKEWRRAHLLQPRISIRMRIQKRANCPNVTQLRCKIKRARAVKRCAGSTIHTCTGRQEKCCELVVANCRRHHERRQPIFPRMIDWCSCLQQHRSFFNCATLCRHMKGRPARAIHLAHRCPRRDQAP
eukprot:6196983-Pleurochrysis_carterae.AAC.1